MPPNPLWNCKIGSLSLFTCTLWSTLLILSMTFERFYSIIRPHKAASYNTIKRAKITIMCIATFGVSFNVPHIFLSINNGVRCTPYPPSAPYVDVYYWLSFVLSFIFPFVSLLSMNSVIIHTLRKRSVGKLTRSQGYHQSEGQNHEAKLRSTDKQIFTTLLLVTFGLLVLTTPVYSGMLYVQVFGYGETPRQFAGYYLFYHIAQKTYYTNNGINFFFYVLSGQKFRNDLMKLFKCKRENSDDVSVSNLSDVSTITTSH